MKFLLILNMLFTLWIFLRLADANKTIKEMNKANSIFKNDWLSYTYSMDGKLLSGKAFAKKFGDDDLTVINLYDSDSKCTSIEFVRNISNLKDPLEEMLSLRSAAEKYVEDMRAINDVAAGSKKNSLIY